MSMGQQDWLNSWDFYPSAFWPILDSGFPASELQYFRAFSLSSLRFQLLSPSEQNAHNRLESSSARDRAFHYSHIRHQTPITLKLELSQSTSRPSPSSIRAVKRY